MSYNAFHLRQPQAHSPVRFFGREKWFEYFCQREFVHPLARVAYAAAHISSRPDFSAEARGVSVTHLNVLCLDENAASARHRIPRIHAEIDQYLFHLHWIGANIP